MGRLVRAHDMYNWATRARLERQDFTVEFLFVHKKKGQKNQRGNDGRIRLSNVFGVGFTRAERTDWESPPYRPTDR